VTTYVRDEMFRAERFAEGNEQRRVNAGFALQGHVRQGGVNRGGV